MFNEVGAEAFMRAIGVGRVMLVSVAAALAVCAGCGGGGSSTTSSSGSGSTTVSAPTITVQPVSQAVSSGSAVTLSVTATGDGTLSYQWYKDSTAISGATSASYAIASASSSDAGAFYVVVTNSGGSTTSSTATLSIAATTTASCDTTYVDGVLSAVAAFETAVGSTLTAATQYDNAAYTTAQLNVYKTNWSNLPPGALQFSRPGMTLANVTTAAQVAAFNALAKAALSTSGYADFQGVIAADDYLGYTKNANGYGADLYHVAFIGTPSQAGAWTLMLGGHHLAFNINFNAACAYPTPHHIGVEPRTAFTANNHTSYNFYDSGSYTVLDAKASAMLAVFGGLDSTSLSSAFLTGQTFSDILIGPVEASTGSYTAVKTKFNAIASSSTRGVLVSGLTTAQQALVSAAITQFTGDYDSATAARLLADYQAGYASTYVAWANAAGTYSSSGPDVAANATYMRIDGPRVWIEIAVQNGIVIQNQTHYHVMFRDKTTDYFNQLAS
jgi:hypothetical protein